MSFDKVEVRVFSGPDQVQVGSNTEPDLIVMNIGPKGDTGATGNTGPAGPNSVTSATTSDGTANLSLSNVSTATATVSGLLTAGHIHGNLAGTLYTHVRTGEAMSKGDPFYISGFHVGSSQPIAMRADASDPLKMPAVGVMDADYAINTSSANGIISGTLSSVDTDGYAVNSPIYVANGGGYSNTAGTIPQQVGITERANANTGAFIVTNSKVISFADISDAQTGTADLILENLTATNIGSGTASIGLALIVGDGDSVKGRYDIFGNTSHFQWYSDSALYGERSFTITTDNLTSSGSYVYKYPVGNGTLALTGNTNGEPDKLTAGTISGATTFNATSYTYGTGAAAAHRTALGLTTLATTTPAANVATFLETPSSANLAAAVTDETGSGSLVFGTSPTLTTPTIAQINGNTTASGTLTLQSTTNDTKGKILFGTSAYDETTNALGIGNTSPSYKLEIGNASAALDALNSSIGLGVLSSSTRNLFLIESTAVSSSSAGAFIGAYSNDGSAMASGDRLGGFFFGGYDGSVMRNAAIIHAFSEEAWSGGANGTGVTIGTTAAGTTSRSDKFFFRSSGSLLIGTPTENTKSILTLESTTRGFLPPRMTTTQRNAITSVPAGLMVYNTTLNKLNFYNGTTWETVTSL